MIKILVTGSSGFIGFHLCLRLLKKNTKNIKIFGLDNHNDYYDVNLKMDRLKILKKYSNFKFFSIDISDKKKLLNNFKKNKYNFVINLAAQAGVRYSVENPKAYFDSNLLGFFNIIEASKENKIKHLLFASSSSVYGNNNNFPLSESEDTSKPLSFYAATKKCNEVIAYSYSNIYKLPSTALRFFTVYGPYGRPDMALFKFTDLILKDKKIDVFGMGKHQRDFTYIDDIVNGIEKLIMKPPKKINNYFNVFNIASNQPQKLSKYINHIENQLSKKAKINLIGIQIGDVIKTHGDTQALYKYIGYKPSFNIQKGISKFIEWYMKYYRSKN
jgi:UDP-glucuronate 4-epimerase